MSIINKSYFYGDISIAQLDDIPTANNLQVFINRYENLMLKACLGLDLYNDFMAGLQLSPIPQKWLDLRDGKQFTATGMWPPYYWQYPWLYSTYRSWFIPQTPFKLIEWCGFTAGGNAATSNVPDTGLLVLTVDSGSGNPVSNQKTFTLSKLAGSKYWIERRNFGTMIEGIDVSITNNGQTITLLKIGDVFNPNEIFIIHFTSQIQSTPVSPNDNGLVSPIANYVYYRYLRDQITNNTATGVVSSRAENATNASPAFKMTDAFNQMSKDVFCLWQFLDAMNTDVYASYDRMKIDYNFFKPINQFNL